MKKLFLLAALCGLVNMGVNAQRMTDKLDRGLVAVKVSGGVFCSWRVMGEEYYDVKYNLYRDGTKIAENLDVSNYVDGASELAPQMYAILFSFIFISVLPAIVYRSMEKEEIEDPVEEEEEPEQEVVEENQ